MKNENPEKTNECPTPEQRLATVEECVAAAAAIGNNAVADRLRGGDTVEAATVEAVVKEMNDAGTKYHQVSTEDWYNTDDDRPASVTCKEDEEWCAGSDLWFGTEVYRLYYAVTNRPDRPKGCYITRKHHDGMGPSDSVHFNTHEDGGPSPVTEDEFGDKFFDHELVCFSSKEIAAQERGEPGA